MANSATDLPVPPDRGTWYRISEESTGAPDPRRNPEFYEGVLVRRSIAYCIDLAIIGVIAAGVLMLMAILGLFTFGLLWVGVAPVLFALAILYDARTLGGAAAATPGMRLMGLEMRTWDGWHPSFIQAALHSATFYVSIMLATILILAVGLFSSRARLAHDFLCGTVVIRDFGWEPVQSRVTATSA